MWYSFMDDIVYSYTTKQAVEDGVLVKIESDSSRRTGILFPVYFTEAVWRRYVDVPPEFAGIQDLNARLGDILFMFAFQAKKCSGSVLYFQFTCQVPKACELLGNERKSCISFQHREVKLKAVITAQDIDDPSPSIFIMLPSED